MPQHCFPYLLGEKKNLGLFSRLKYFEGGAFKISRLREGAKKSCLNFKTLLLALGSQIGGLPPNLGAKFNFYFAKPNPIFFSKKIGKFLWNHVGGIKKIPIFPVGGNSKGGGTTFSKKKKTPLVFATKREFFSEWARPFWTKAFKKNTMNFSGVF